MKNLMLTVVLFCLSFAGFAQTNAPLKMNLPALDKSPMDMAYFPDNYPVLKIQGKAAEPLLVRVIYSRPQRDNRTIFGGLVEYNQVWRLGANEATEIEFFKDVKIGSKKIARGRYTLYAIPTPTQWTIIVNRDTDIWGAFKYDPKKDVVRIDVPVEKTTIPAEAFSINFEKTENGVNMVMSWDDVTTTLPIVTK